MCGGGGGGGGVGRFDEQIIRLPILLVKLIS